MYGNTVIVKISFGEASKYIQYQLLMWGNYTKYSWVTEYRYGMYLKVK